MVRMLLVTPSLLASSVIARALRCAPDIRIVGAARSAGEALERAGDFDLALVSTTLPDGTALDLVKLLSRDHPQVRVLILGLAETGEEIMPYVEAGVAGYVRKADTVETLLTKIRAARRQEALVSPGLAWALIARVAELAQVLDERTTLAPFSSLTPRELDVLALLAEDLSDAEIADCLTLAKGTVKSHVHRILKKLDVPNRKEAAAFWVTAQKLLDGASDR
jgi:DNA-binding NarL/FixJ family response regulator